MKPNAGGCGKEIAGISPYRNAGALCDTRRVNW
jgi:hypothetical protein